MCCTVLCEVIFHDHQPILPHYRGQRATAAPMPINTVRRIAFAAGELIARTDFRQQTAQKPGLAVLTQNITREGLSAGPYSNLS
jgi:hypothetical protein